MTQNLNLLMKNENEFFRFMREKYPIFNNSNIFLRDLQYAVFSYFDLKGNKLKYPDSEKLAISFADELIKGNKLIKLSHNTWRVNFSLEEFVENELIKETEIISL